MKKRLLWQLPFLALLIIGTVWIVSNQHNMPYQHQSGVIFGTQYHVTYQSNDNLQQEIENVLKQVDNEFSMFNKTSTVTLINEGKSPQLSEMFVEVFTLAQEINKESNGAFDITVAPLVNAWGFGFKTRQMPNANQVDSLLAYVGMNKLVLTQKKGKSYMLLSQPGITLDFSAIAKGYGTDCVARLLSEKEIENYMVEIGGEVVTKGNNPKRLPWKIGVEKPMEDSLHAEGEFQTILNVTDQAMATSGNYRNFYYKGGRKYAHTIDPKSGRPVQHSLLSATVLTDCCAKADGYATAFMVMGIEKAKILLNKHPELKACFIYADDKGRLHTWMSPGLENRE